MKSLIIWLVLLMSHHVHGQTTTVVTATVTDPNSQIYANGTFTVAFWPVPGTPPANYNINGSPFQQQFSGALDATGTFTVTVSSNAVITPSKSQWQFSVCPQASAGCFQLTLPISGASMNISSQLSAASPPITVQPSLTSPRAYQDSEVVTPPNPGAIYFNLTSQTHRAWNGASWNPMGGGGGGGAWNSITAATNNNTGSFISTGNAWDFTLASHTSPVKVGTLASIPGTCGSGEQYFANDQPAGQTLYGCNPANTWTLEGSASVVSKNTTSNTHPLAISHAINSQQVDWDTNCLSDGIGNITGCGSLTVTNNINSTTGNINATTGNVTAGGNVNAGAAVTAVTNVTVGTAPAGIASNAHNGWGCNEGSNTGWTPTVGTDYVRCDNGLHTMVISNNGAAETPLPGNGSGSGGAGQVSAPIYYPARNRVVGLSLASVVTVTNTTSVTSLIGNSYYGRNKILAGTLLPTGPGIKTMRVMASGTIGTAGSLPTLTIGLLLNGSTSFNFASIPLVINMAGAPWVAEFYITPVSGGAPLWEIVGIFHIVNATGSSGAAQIVGFSTSTSGAALLQDVTVDVTAQWGTASSSNSITASTLTMGPAFAY